MLVQYPSTDAGLFMKLLDQNNIRWFPSDDGKVTRFALEGAYSELWFNKDTERFLGTKLDGDDKIEPFVGRLTTAEAEARIEAVFAGYHPQALTDLQRVRLLLREEGLSFTEFGWKRQSQQPAAVWVSVRIRIDGALRDLRFSLSGGFDGFDDEPDASYMDQHSDDELRAFIGIAMSQAGTGDLARVVRRLRERNIEFKQERGEDSPGDMPLRVVRVVLVGGAKELRFDLNTERFLGFRAEGGTLEWWQGKTRTAEDLDAMIDEAMGLRRAA